MTSTGSTVVQAYISTLRLRGRRLHRQRYLVPGSLVPGTVPVTCRPIPFVIDLGLDPT